MDSNLLIKMLAPLARPQYQPCICCNLQVDLQILTSTFVHGRSQYLDFLFMFMLQLSISLILYFASLRVIETRKSKPGALEV